MTQDDDIGAALKRSLRVLTIATVALYLFVLAAVVYVGIDGHNKRVVLRASEGRTTAALCALRSDLNQRVLSSETALAIVPPGPKTPIEEAAITSLKAGIVNTKRTVNALSGLRC